MTKQLLAIYLILGLFTPLHAQENALEPEAAPAAASGTALESPESPAPITERFAAPQMTRAERLAQALPADTELQTFESDSETYYALIQLANVAESHGNVLILPDIVSGDVWVEQSAHMRRYLADHGWTTLVMEMPLPAPIAHPQRTLPIKVDPPVVSESETPPPTPEASPATPPVSTTESTTEPDAEPELILAPYTERISQRIRNGLEELRLRDSSLEERWVIIAIGSSAGWAADYIQQMPELDRPVLLMIDPRPALSAEQPDLLANISTLNSLVIDLYHTPLPGKPTIIPDARQRRQMAQRSAHPDYHQARISGTFRGWNTPWLSRQIRGKLKRHLLEENESDDPSLNETAPTEQRPPGRNPVSFDL
ncbi:DUF3530 family protein [Nitrincola sp. MINF-07-Sa-05]|uniref:DUF3530 family protein n=1 Tax=Nitrincola salilacus TaxID=3400273 RepID=UPI003917B7DB